MRNPIDYMILRTGLNRSEFAVKHGFGKNLLGRLAQGRGRSVTPRIKQALWGEWESRGIDSDEFDAEYGTTDIDVAYQRWVNNRRIMNRVSLPVKVKDDPAISPFARIVQAIGSVSKTAQVLAVADVLVQRYADGRHKAMPESIREALTVMGYKHLHDLDKAQQRWHMKQSA